MNNSQNITQDEPINQSIGNELERARMRLQQTVAEGRKDIYNRIVMDIVEAGQPLPPFRFPSNLRRTF